MQPPSRLAVRPVLQSAQGGGAGHCALNADRRLHGNVLAQRSVVVQVFPAQGKAIDTLAQHVAHGVGDEQGVARIGNVGRCALGQSNLAVYLLNP